jgi:hypothetical protein
MGAILRFRPSPALVVASLALLVALGEASWATVSQLLPRNSVGTAQLRANAVTSTKIRNGAVSLSDLARSARRPGPAGPVGPAGPAGPTGPAGQAGATGPAGVVTRLWAVVNQSGSLARAVGTTSAGRVGEGAYEVFFNQDVTNCVFSGSIGDPGTITSVSGTVSVGRRSGNANGIRVDTRTTSGDQADRPFHVVVVC